MLEGQPEDRAAAPVGIFADGGRGIFMSEVRPRSLVEIVGRPDTLILVRRMIGNVARVVPLPFPGRWLGRDGTLVATLAFGRHLVVSDTAALEDALRLALDPEEAVVIDLAKSSCGFRVSGTAASRLLGKGLAVDFDLPSLAAGSALQGQIGPVAVTAIRRETEVFDLFVSDRCALAFADWLMNAAAEFGWCVSAPVAVGG